MWDHCKFIIPHSPVNLANLPPDITLNTFIREHAQLTATKFMCQEGGCGVCVCVVRDGKRTWAVNSVSRRYNLYSPMDTHWFSLAVPDSAEYLCAAGDHHGGGAGQQEQWLPSHTEASGQAEWHAVRLLLAGICDEHVRTARVPGRPGDHVGGGECIWG